MEKRNPKDAASMRLLGVIAGSALLMAIWFCFHPISALLCSIVAILVSVICIWPPHLSMRDGGAFRQKLND